MTAAQRKKMELLVSSLIGLELWLIGESERPMTVDDDFARLAARLSVYQAILWPHEEQECDGEAAEGADSNEA